jgi:hypothetical protein
MVFQVFDVAADGRLRKVYDFSRFGKTSLLDDIAEYMQLP